MARRKITNNERQPIDTAAELSRFQADQPVGEGASSDKEQISARAYERFEARGRQHGRDLEDWLEAERDVRGSSIDQDDTLDR